MASVMIRHLPTGLRALKSAMSPQISQDQRPLALVWRAWSAAAEQGGIESGQSGTEQPQAEAGSSATTLAEEVDHSLSSSQDLVVKPCLPNSLPFAVLW